MVYIVVRAKILGNGTVLESTRREKLIWPAELDEGGLYFLNPGNLYRVLEKCKEG